MNLDPDIARDAHRLFHDPAFRAVMEELASTVISEWTSSSPAMSAAREIAYHKHTAIDEIVAVVRRWSEQHVA